MTLWCIMLFSQAFLVRIKRFSFHKLTGSVSFLLVAFVVISGFSVSHLTVSRIPETLDAYYYLTALMFNSMIAFLLIYILAMFYRKNPAKHARFMVCTILPMFTPITDRLIFRFFPSLVEHAPTLNGMPIVPFFGFVLAMSILFILLIWDLISNRRYDVFPVVFVILFLYQYAVMYFYQYEFWRSFSRWLMSLPLS